MHQLIDVMNRTTFNPVGLNIMWPKNVGFIFVSDGLPAADARILTFYPHSWRSNIMYTTFLYLSSIPSFELTRFGQ